MTERTWLKELKENTQSIELSIGDFLLIDDGYRILDVNLVVQVTGLNLYSKVEHGKRFYGRVVNKAIPDDKANKDGISMFRNYDIVKVFEEKTLNEIIEKYPELFV